MVIMVGRIVVVTIQERNFIPNLAIPHAEPQSARRMDVLRIIGKLLIWRVAEEK